MPLTAGLFRTHVRGGTGVLRAVAHLFLGQRHAEVRDIRLAGCIEQDITRFNVAMNEPGAVGILQRFRDRRHQFDRFTHGETRLLDSLGE